MDDYKRLALLIIIMTGVCLIVGATAIGVLYQAAFDRESARLVNIVQSQARLMETMRRFDLEHARRTGDPVPDTLAQVIAAHRILRGQGVGKTGEITLARREDDTIVWLSRSRREEIHAPQTLPLNTPLAEPMRAALSGRSGTMIGIDYAGRRVLAAFEPVDLLNLGLVAKIETAEINQRYLRAGAIAGLVSLLAVLGASYLFYHVSEPMIRRIRESENRFRELFENMGSGVAVYEAVANGSDFVFKDLNRAGEHSEHLRRQDVIGKRLTEIYPRIREFGLVDVLQRVWQTGTAESLPARLYRDEWRDDWWRENYVYRLPNGEVVALFDDVSERIRSEQALRQSEARYRTLVEEQPDPISQFLPDTTLTFVNRAYAAFYGREPEELIGRRWLDFAAKDDRPRFLDELSTFTPEHPERHEETHSRGADGTVHWYLCHLHAFFDDAGQVLSFQTFATDITERKRAEKGLAESERRAREQLLELETLYRTAPIGLVLYDRALNFVRINEALAGINGRSIEDHLGRHVWDVMPQLREAVEPQFQRVLATGEPVHFEVSGETPKAPGMRRDWIAQYYPLKGTDGSVVAIGGIVQEVTEQKRAERGLQEAVAQYKAMGEAVPYGVWLCGPDGGARYVSQSFLDLLDMSMDEMQQFGWTRRLPPEDVEPMLQRWLACVRTGEPWDSEHRIIGRDGEIHHVLARGRPVRDSDGTITSWAGINLDITERKRAEQALRESEARYRTVGEAIPYGVWICNSKGGVEYVSHSFLDLIGKTLDDVKPRGWLDCLPPEDVKPVLEAWQACVRTGGEWTWEHRVKGKDGVWRSILSLGRPVRNAQGRITSWGGFNLDISQRKQAEDALRESEARFRGTFENAAVGIANVGRNGAWLRVNQRLCEILGYSRAEFLQKNFREMTHPEDLPVNLERFSALMRGKIGTYQLEKRYLHKDGHAVWVNVTAAVQRDQAGDPAYCIAIIEDISSRKRAEEALRESEARLRRAVENAPFPIMVHAEDGNVVHLSRAWLELTGYTREEISTIAAWTERAYGERKEVVRADIDRLYVLDRALDEGEYRIYTKDDRTRIWNFHSAPLGSDSRGRRLVVSMAADVTERKKAEQALRESELRMRALLDASQDEILLVSIDGEVLAINKAAKGRLARQTGGADPVGAHLDRLLSEDQVEKRMELIRQVAATAALVHCEVPIRSRWFEFWFYPVLPPDGLVREVAVYAREITEQRKYLAELSKLSQAIQQSPMSVVITDRTGVIEYVNPEFTKVTGYTAEEAIGQNPRILKSGHMRPEYYAELWNTITGGGAWRGELLNRRKNGELFWELASIAPVKAGEMITNFVAVKEDITDRKETEDQLRQSQKMQVVGQLTGGIAHDFNNLLSIIIGNLQLLEMRLGGDAKAREYFDDALWSARRGGELTRRLLAFARKQPLKPAVIDLNEVVKGITELLRRTLGPSVRIKASLAPNLWKAFADRGELERALVNLAVNSRDAMRSVGTLTLETRNAVLDEDYAEQYEEVTPGEYVLLAVTDTGAGMPPEIVQRVFEPFFTTKEVGKGSGLGLSMVYGFVKQSGGHISIYSRAGHGTCVKLYLPRAASSSQDRQEDSSDVFPEDLGDKVVLVVEDEARLRKAAVRMLDQLGLRSIQAESAEDALEFLADTHVDVLFTDIELPGGMSGTELADVAQRLDPNIKVLFTTGYAREAVLHERWLQNKVPWLLKPYSHIELARELKALLVPMSC